jgi:NTE family protein
VDFALTALFAVLAVEQWRSAYACAPLWVALMGYPLALAVRASSSFPVFFKPTQIQGKTYVDGCLVSPVPVDAARKMGADIVLAVDISGQLDRRVVFDGISNVIDQSLIIMIKRLGEQELAHADVVIRPKVGKFGATDFDQKDKAILEGEKAVTLAMPSLRLAVQKWQASHS